MDPPVCSKAGAGAAAREAALRLVELHRRHANIENDPIGRGAAIHVRKSVLDESEPLADLGVGYGIWMAGFIWLFGPVVGAGIIVTLQDALADKVGSLVSVIMGCIFVVCVLAFRRGIVGELQALYRRATGRRH